jgi:hypothetical protein
MTKFKLFATAAVAALSISVAGLLSPASASAASKLTSTKAYAFSVGYYAAAEVDDATGNGLWAAYWRGKADGIIAASCP